MSERTPSKDDCQQALEQLHAFLDHELSNPDSDDVRSHLNLCEQCLDTYDLTQQVKDLVHAHCGSAAPDGLQDKILRSLRQA